MMSTPRFRTPDVSEVTVKDLIFFKCQFSCYSNVSAMDYNLMTMLQVLRYYLPKIYICNILSELFSFCLFSRRQTEFEPSWQDGG